MLCGVHGREWRGARQAAELHSERGEDKTIGLHVLVCVWPDRRRKMQKLTTMTGERLDSDPPGGPRNTDRNFLLEACAYSFALKLRKKEMVPAVPLWCGGLWSALCFGLGWCISDLQEDPAELRGCQSFQASAPFRGPPRSHSSAAGPRRSV